MCGIIVHSNSTPFLSTENTKELLNKRGKDNFTTLHTKNTIFFHSLLALTDAIENTVQPLENENFVVLLNGEIYNHLDLRASLFVHHSFKTQTDTETLLLGFQELGIAFFQYLRGMFAFVIYDKKKDKLIISRDQFGIKPLYFHQQNKALILSSSLDYFKPFPVNNQQLKINKKWGWSLGNQTLFKDVHQFPKGKTAIFDCKTGQLDYLKTTYKTNKKPKTSLFELIKESVKEQTNSFYPSAILFSGGVDSTLLALASKEIGLNLPLYTFDFKGNQQKNGYSEDFIYAKKIASKLNLELRIVSYNKEDFEEYLKQHSDFPEPYLDLAGFSLHLLCKQAKKDGIKILLNGTGADEFFGGYRRHLFAKKFDWLPQFTQKRALSYLISKSNKKLSVIEKKALGNYKRDSFSQFVLSYDQNEYLENNNLKYTDGIGLFNEIEIRVPFLTPEITSFGQKRLYEGVLGKTDLKSILYQHFPKEWIDRKKSGFALPIQSLNKKTSKLRNDLLKNWFK